MHDQESFANNARWLKSGVKSGVFIMYPFSSFNNFFPTCLIVSNLKLAFLLRKYCWIMMELVESLVGRKMKKYLLVILLKFHFKKNEYLVI